MDCFHLLTARKEGKAVVTLETAMVDIVDMYSISVVQEEFFLIKITEDRYGGVRIDKVTDCFCLKIAIIPITSRWSVLRLRLMIKVP